MNALKIFVDELESELTEAKRRAFFYRELAAMAYLQGGYDKGVYLSQQQRWDQMEESEREAARKLVDKKFRGWNGR